MGECELFGGSSPAVFGQSVWTVVSGAGGQVFVGSSTGTVYEVSAATGAMVSMDDAGGAGDEAPGMAIAENHLFVPLGDTLVVY